MRKPNGAGSRKDPKADPKADLKADPKADTEADPQADPRAVPEDGRSYKRSRRAKDPRNAPEALLERIQRPHPQIDDDPQIDDSQIDDSQT